jgi:hypothetical protein
VKLDFSYDGNVVGHFLDVSAYPRATGRYRYMPYRSLGHLRFREECRRSGSARCSYPGPDGLVTFVARAGDEYGVLEIDDVRDSP